MLQLRSQSIYNVQAAKQLCDRVNELALSKNEDAPSTLAVHKEVHYCS